MIRQLDVPIYNTNVLFLLETTSEEWIEFCSKETNKDKLSEEDIKEVSDEISSDTCGGSVVTLLNNDGYVTIIKDANYPTYYLHEVYHTADSILKDRGVEHTEDDEAYAYMIGWLGQQYCDMLEEFNKEKEDWDESE
jgi:hypothetical protein